LEYNIDVYDKADKVLDQIESLQKDTFFPLIGPEKGQVLARMVAMAKPKLILEIGTLVGYSAILMAKYLPENGRIITCEIDKKSALEASRNVSLAGFSNKIQIIVGDAKKTIKNIKEQIDLLFLDAAKEEYLKYLKLAEPNLKLKGLVVADNVKIFKGNMEDFLDYVRNSGKYKSETFDFGQDAVEVSIKL